MKNYLSWQLPAGLEEDYKIQKIVATTKNVTATLYLIIFISSIILATGYYLAPAEQKMPLLIIGIISESVLGLTVIAMRTDARRRMPLAYIQPVLMIAAIWGWMHFYVARLPANNQSMAQGMAIIFVLAGYAMERLNPRVGILSGAGTTLIYLWQRHYHGMLEADSQVQVFAQTLIVNILGVHILLTNARADRKQYMLTKELEAERFLSDNLLKKILPESIAPKLRSNEHLPAESVSSSSILFADIVGFTSLAERISPNQLVSLLNDIFSKFDQLAEKFGVEKIKTIGDGYMAVAGCLEEQPDHALRATRLAVAMREALTEFCARNDLQLNLRIGIHSGPVIAGVIGEKRFGFDVWGDSVNIASRMESSAIPGDIQVSGATAELISGSFNLSPAKLVDIKGKGQLPTCTVLAAKHP